MFSCAGLLGEARLRLRARCGAQPEGNNGGLRRAAAAVSGAGVGVGAGRKVGSAAPSAAMDDI